MNKKYKLKTKVWIWPAQTASWHFVNISKTVSKELKEAYGKKTKGFGSIPVEVTVGKTVWKTSVFPDKKSDTYILPLKAVIRKIEGIYKGDTITFTIEIKI